MVSAPWSRFRARHQPIRSIDWVDTLIFLYTCNLLGIGILNRWFRNDIPFLDAASTFMILLLVPYLLVFGYALAVRSVVAAGCTLIAIGILVTTYSLYPNPQPTFTGDAALSVMTFNVGLGTTPSEGIIESIEESGMDVVAIQEYVPELDQLLQAELAQTYPHQFLELDVAHIGLLSRYPIVSAEWIDSPINRPILHAVIDWEGELVDLYAVHFKAPHLELSGIHESTIEAEAEFLMERVTIGERPVLVMGDFNMSDQSYPYRKVSGALNDAFLDSGRGFGFTFPHRIFSPLPLVRIDYQFYEGSIAPTSAEVACFDGDSNHCALQATYKITD